MVLELLQQSEVSEMSRDLFDFFLTATMAEDKGHDFPDKLKNSQAYQIMEKWCEKLNLDATDWAKCLLSDALGYNPACLTMWAQVIKEMNESGISVNMREIGLAFGNGFPTEEGMRSAWYELKDRNEAQKWKFPG